MLKHAMRICCGRLNLSLGAQLRGWPFALTNGQQRWNGGKMWTRHIDSRSRTGATISLPRSRPVR